MKRMKKLASLILATIMVLAMAIPAAAANSSTDTTGSITITNAAKGFPYTIYKILDLESFKTGDSPKEGNYSYRLTKTNPDDSWEACSWYEFFNTYTIGEEGSTQKVFNIDPQGYVTIRAGVDQANVDIATLAKKALEYAKNKKIANNGQQTLPENDTTGEVVFSNLPLGYYLVDSPLGTLCMLNTTNPDMKIEEKNIEPGLVKEVKENPSEDWGKVADADRGDIVDFRVTITAQAGAERYVLHDKMDAGLKFIEGSVKVTIMRAGSTETEDVALTDDYTVVSKVDISEGCTFHVNFEQQFCDTLKNGDKIVVEYQATVQKEAWQEGLGVNEAHLAYGDSFKTETDKVIVKTWEIKVFKYFQDGSDKTGLAGAKFTLSRKSDGTEPIAFIEGEGATGEKLYRVAPKDTTDSTITEIETNANGHFIFRGLDSGIYYLTETAAPEGYNKLSGALMIEIKKVIDEKGEVTSEVIYNGKTVDEVEVLNQSGSLLPSTGGIGTTIFYIVGGILVVAAAVLLVTRKRMSTEK